MTAKRVLLVAGARPNFMKAAPVLSALRRVDGLECSLVHTGQHYDEAMSRLFFEELGIPAPDVDLEVGSASHAVQTARILERFEPVVRDRRPDLLVVVGDVNSTLACSLVAAKLGVPVAHVEAGLRSFDRTMPEEINRILTDAISDLLFVTEPSGVENLLREGREPARIHLVGNVMIDTLLAHRDRARRSTILERCRLRAREYAVLTLHRPANVDSAATLASIFEAIADLARRIPVVFPVHPRTREAMAAIELPAGADVRTVEPLGYLDFLRLLEDARIVLTDSGGIQEETTVLRVPCVTLRNNTERPITVSHGTNRIGGTTRDAIRAAVEDALASNAGSLPPPPLWDGGAAVRIAAIVAEWLRA